MWLGWLAAKITGRLEVGQALRRPGSAGEATSRASGRVTLSSTIARASRAG